MQLGGITPTHSAPRSECPLCLLNIFLSEPRGNLDGHGCIGDGVVKIGATMRASPLPRLKELSRSLPTDFQLVSMVPSTDPFGLESRAHAHFAAKRVMRSSTGRTTEFFTVSREEVDEYFAGVMGGGKD